MSIIRSCSAGEGGVTFRTALFSSCLILSFSWFTSDFKYSSSSDGDLTMISEKEGEEEEDNRGRGVQKTNFRPYNAGCDEPRRRSFLQNSNTVAHQMQLRKLSNPSAATTAAT